MSCEELRDSYELYALGVAEEPERSEIRGHLDRQCGICMAGVRDARQFVALLSGTAEPATPPARLRKRILASAGYEPRFRWTAVWPALAAACLLVAIYVGARERRAEEEAGRLRVESRRQASDLSRLHEAFAILNGPNTTEASFGQGQPRPPRGKVFVNPARGVLLVAANLPPAPSGRIYEMWVIPKTGRPAPAGLFQAGSDGSALHIQSGPVDLSATGAVAVTVENEGGAAQPTSEPLIVAALREKGRWLWEPETAQGVAAATEHG